MKNYYKIFLIKILKNVLPMLYPGNQKNPYFLYSNIPLKIQWTIKLFAMPKVDLSHLQFYDPLCLAW